MRIPTLRDIALIPVTATLWAIVRTITTLDDLQLRTQAACPAGDPHDLWGDTE
jgi:hypothetical protein